MGRAVPHEMTDEEYELFSDRFAKICTILDGLPYHLVTPLLIRVTVGTYLDMLGLSKSNENIALAQSLATQLTETLLSNTNRNITERN